MSVLIKAAVADLSVRPFVPAPPHAKPGPSAVAVATRVEDDVLGLLRQENEKLRKDLADADEARQQAERKGREEGRKEALEAARLEDEKKLAALKDGLAGALEKWRESLDGLDRLAPLIARSALSKLFDESEDHNDFVARMIARQIGRLRRESIVRILVSGEDFPDAEALAALRSRGGTGEVELVRDLDLAAGECRLDLALGHIDLGVRAQWGELSSLLEDTIFEGTGA
jgi:flagellar assembly protein FliH